MNDEPRDISPDAPMTPQRDEQLLASHLASRLDAHLGCARRGFESMLAQEAAASGPLRIADARPGGWTWQWSLGLVAAAACVLVTLSLLLTLNGGRENGTSIASGPGGGDPLQNINFTALEYSESWDAADLGVYEFGGQPVRAVHQQQWERTRHHDSGYEVQIEVPRSNLVLYDAPVQ